MSEQAALLRQLDATIHQAALDIRMLAKRAGFSDAAAWRAADVIAMGSMLALGGNPSEAYSFALTDLFDPEERRDVTEADFPAVNRHMTDLRFYLKRLPPDDEWRARPKRQFVGWPEHARPNCRPPVQPEADDG